jgi:hypothetical protein
MGDDRQQLFSRATLHRPASHHCSIPIHHHHHHNLKFNTNPATPRLLFATRKLIKPAQQMFILN